MSWQFDYNHSEIQFSVRHMMVSTVRGQFEKFTGTVQLDEKNPANSSVVIEIDPSSINTRSTDRDNHLKSPDFFDVANYPTITFKSTKIEQVDANHGKITGDLTIRGITKPVVVNVEYQGQSQNPFAPIINAGFSGTTTINRKEWGLTWNMGLETGGVLVGDDIKVAVEVELVKQVEAEPAGA
jgi:polyisoprenoid-binding protein YceI